MYIFNANNAIWHNRFIFIELSFKTNFIEIIVQILVHIIFDEDTLVSKNLV